MFSPEDRLLWVEWFDFYHICSVLFVLSCAIGLGYVIGYQARDKEIEEDNDD